MINIGVLTSGGDSPGMNGAVRSVTRCAIDLGMNVFGIRRGYSGLLDREIVPLRRREVGGIVQKGGTFLGTSRCPTFLDVTNQEKAKDILEDYGIEGLIVIGGDGSLMGAWALSKLGVPTITVPGTIDNDMCGTEYTIGFDTALNTIIDSVSKIRDTISSHARVAVVEVMGRHAGHLALHAGIACGAEVILLPEAPMPLQDMCNRLYESHSNGKTYSIVLVAEGAYSSYDVYDYIKEHTYFDPTLTVLGYVQRGGSPSAKDNIMGALMGYEAVKSLHEGRYDRLIGLKAGKIVDIPYEDASCVKYAIDKDLYHLLEVLSS